ncbi:Aste57867_10617 [Aphanomyces stellatus]|uniref:Aste57867_10617 protein n=1 Tax=Aphanomyces stellatus TaxID=120398 RepID=A0A485KQU6_9STRA|nr:hypothetical protein As57867_010577 [Aphanomyces stellatus]VFT87489.1 Aste57867_10617 [Aphanomyces stellatus]
MSSRQGSMDSALLGLKLSPETHTPLPATSQGPRRRKESLLYPEGSPHRIHALHKQDGVVKLVEGWNNRVGSICPYIAPSAVADIAKYSYETYGSPKKTSRHVKTPASPLLARSPLRGGRKLVHETTRLPSPTKPAWDASTSTTSPDVACNLHIILHNHNLALTHSHEKLPLAPKYLSKIVLKHHEDAWPLYGMRMQTDAEKAMHIVAPTKSTLAWTLRVHPLHGVNLIDPCRMRKAHVCNRMLRPCVQVRVDGVPVKPRCKPSFSVGPSPVWSNGWLVLPLETSLPQGFEVRVLNACGDRDLLVGAATVSLLAVDTDQSGCAFHTLRNRRGQATGQIKLMFVLEPTTKPPDVVAREAEKAKAPRVEAALSPRAKLLFGDELRMKKAALRHIETSSLVVVKAPPMHSIEETRALWANLEAQVRANPRLRRWSHVDGGGQPVGEGIHACVKQIRIDGRVWALKEYRYELQQGTEPPLPPYRVLQAFLHELDILASVHHDNIVSVVGVVLEPKMALVTEYMDSGRCVVSILKDILTTASVYLCRANDQLWATVTIQQKAYIALQIACAVAYLHENNILHRDIKSHNVVLAGLSASPSAIPTAKLCDLGSAIVITSEDEKPVDEIGTTGYIAPEVASGQGYSFPSDIWSFGMFLWELFSPASTLNPYAGLTSDAFIDKVTDGYRPSMADSTPFATLLDECWRLIPSERPTAAALVAELTQAIDHANASSSSFVK